MKPLVGLDADDPVALAPDAGHLAVLDDVDAHRVGAARVAPGDRIVPRGAAAPLQRRAEDRDSAGLSQGFSGGQKALACAGVSHSLSTPFSRLAWTWRCALCTSWTLCASIITPRGLNMTL